MSDAGPDTEKEPPEPSKPKATARDVRILGSVFTISGVSMLWWGNGWAVDGIIPVPWWGIAMGTLGIIMILVPKPFQRRASRFNEIGEQLRRKPPSE